MTLRLLEFVISVEVFKFFWLFDGSKVSLFCLIITGILMGGGAFFTSFSRAVLIVRDENG